MQNKTKIIKKANWQLVFLVVKWLVPFFIALLIYKKFYKESPLEFSDFKSSLLSLEWYWLLVVFLFSILNWGLEVLKWQFLIKKLEPQSFRKAVKSVLSGIAVSQLLPYRTGEYIGRIAFVSDANKIQAGILSVAGSFSQLLVTLFVGIFAFLYLHPLEYPVYFSVAFMILMAGLMVLYFCIPGIRLRHHNKVVDALRAVINLLNRRDLVRLLCLSGLRYITFLVPYILLSAHFETGMESSLFYYTCAVACIFFLQTVSPNFILTDFFIRISVPALVFSGNMMASHAGGEYIPGMIIYLFNIALPMCCGAFVLLLLRLKR